MKTTPCLCLALILGLFNVAQTEANTPAVTTKNLALRSGPAVDTPLIKVVKIGMPVSLLEPTPTGKYYHVRTTEGQEGWLWSRGVCVGVCNSSHARGGSRALAHRPIDLEQEPNFQVLSASACQSDLASCPVTGCESPDTPHGIMNQRKRTAPDGTSAPILTFDDFASLQQQADNLVGENHELSADQRAHLRGLTVSAGQVSEGDPVTIAGYLVDVPHPNTGESVNCNLKGEANNDYHITLSNDPSNTGFQGIVVEMIPQNRDPGWNLAVLTQTETNGQLVLVTGALFYDNLHFVNSDPNNPRRGQPHRFSLWEVHPITQFAVCTKSDNTCDPSQAGDWAPISSSQ